LILTPDIVGIISCEIMEKWLKCEIQNGMFSDEVTVRVTSAKGEAIAVFVPKGKVQSDHQAVRVRSFVASGYTFAELPDDRGTTLSVRASDLQPA
jgi:hypothetical protein